jgi:hypothetical protein
VLFMGVGSSVCIVTVCWLYSRGSIPVKGSVFFSTGPDRP